METAAASLMQAVSDQVLKQAVEEAGYKVIEVEDMKDMASGVT